MWNVYRIRSIQFRFYEQLLELKNRVKTAVRNNENKNIPIRTLELRRNTVLQANRRCENLLQVSLDEYTSAPADLPRIVNNEFLSKLLNFELSRTGFQTFRSIARQVSHARSKAKIAMCNVVVFSSLAWSCEMTIQ